MLELGKVYKWTEIVQHYPDMYVVIVNVKREMGEIVTCKLLDVCTKADKHIYREKYIKLGIVMEIQRTTCNDPVIGVLL